MPWPKVSETIHTRAIACHVPKNMPSTKSSPAASASSDGAQVVVTALTGRPEERSTGILAKKWKRDHRKGSAIMRPEEGERGDRVDIRGAKPQRSGIRRRNQTLFVSSVLDEVAAAVENSGRLFLVMHRHCTNSARGNLAAPTSKVSTRTDPRCVARATIKQSANSADGNCSKR